MSDGQDAGTDAADAGGTTPDGGEGGGDGSTAGDAEGRTNGAGDVDGGGEGGEGDEDLDDLPDPRSSDDTAMSAAIDAYEAVLVHALHFSITTTDNEESQLDASATTEECYSGMAACIRDIGTRATPEVLGHQLKILGLRKSPELSRPEAIAVRAFAGVLMDLDAYVAEENAKADAAANVVEPVAPLPIEDTTMEPTTEPMETW
ncbi:hypothetical protein [Rhizobium sp. SGZ-381]|uniref:hypothetical protein n=1 Tax=Rhizobium sp. SGZ-381 TaxID=3342800 RepID=UPI00366EBA19